MKYVTDSKLVKISKRLEDKDYELAHEIISKFTVTKDDTGLNGNVRVGFKNSKATLHNSGDKKVVTMSLAGDGPQTHIPDYEQISSSLALYRLIALFKCGLDAEKCDFYKMNWMITLRHPETNKYLGLGEWKGGFQIFTEGHSVKDLPKKFVKDAEALLTLLASTKCPIGYDGVVAGTVA